MAKQRQCEASDRTCTCDDEGYGSCGDEYEGCIWAGEEIVHKMNILRGASHIDMITDKKEADEIRKDFKNMTCVRSDR